MIHPTRMNLPLMYGEKVGFVELLNKRRCFKRIYTLSELKNPLTNPNLNLYSKNLLFFRQR